MGYALRSPSRQLPLPFDDEPLWDASSLEAALLGECGRPVQLVITDNRAVLLSFRREAGRILLRLHRMFLYAPLDVVRAVARNVRRKNRSAHSEVRRFMNDNLHRARQAPASLPPLVTAGKAHDLSTVYDRLNASFFEGKLRVPLTWGRGGGRARRGGLTFGSYDPVLDLIRIHPVLDRGDVPLYFLESVVYHEMLHHHLGGVPDSAGRTVYHSRRFREAEALYPKYREALAWEKDNLPKLLRANRALDRKKRSEKPQRRTRRPRT